MRKTNTTKLMAALTSLCLATSPFVGSTLAKYITTANSNDDARVSTFGVVLQADGNLFGEDYIDNIEVGKDSTTLAVQASAVARENVVAPGTKNDSGLHFSVTGTPEVATRLEATITAENICLVGAGRDERTFMVPAPDVTADNFRYSAGKHSTPGYNYYYKDGDSYVLATAYDDTKEYYVFIADPYLYRYDYYPLIYKTEGYTPDDPDYPEDFNTAHEIAEFYAYKLAGKNLATPNASSTVVETFSDDENVVTYKVVAEYPPNFNYSSLGVDNANITWEWEFYKEYDENNNDDVDTTLGLLMASPLPNGAVVVIGDPQDEFVKLDESMYNLNTGFNMEITVTQLD